VDDVANLLAEIEGLGDDRALEKVRALVGGVLRMHGAAIAPLVEALRARGGSEAVVEAARAPAVSSVLLLHGLHPVEPLARARVALDALAPTLRAVDASVSVDEEPDGGLRVRVQGGARGAPSAVFAVEAALSEATPDATWVVEAVPAPIVDVLLPASRLTSKRDARPAEDEKESCELCAAEIVKEHEHLIDPSSRDLRCACGACASLFGASSGRWKRVPRRLERLPGLRLGDDLWEALGVPIELAFFYRSTPAARVVAMYPGPAGATESMLSLDAWSRVEAENPVLGDLSADVEALLVRRTREGREHYRVSIDACFALVGRIRKHWKGLGGGQEAWTQIGDYFADLRRATEGSADACTS
jgi:hypothetical protein